MEDTSSWFCALPHMQRNKPEEQRAARHHPCFEPYVQCRSFEPSSCSLLLISLRDSLNTRSSLRRQTSQAAICTLVHRAIQAFPP
jgi:hypothetical protein